MALEPILWAMKDAPIADAEEWAVLSVMAEAGDDDGCNAFKSHKTIAGLVKLDPQTVQRRTKALVVRGLLSPGDQRAAQYIPEWCRPVVYDVMIPYSWFSNIERINEYRRLRGRAPLTPEARPDIAAAPDKKRRADTGKKRQKVADRKAPPIYKTPGVDSASTPPIYETPPISETPTPHLQDADPLSTRGTTHPYNPPLEPPQETTAAAGPVDNSSTTTASDPSSSIEPSNQEPTPDEIAEALLDELPRPWKPDKGTARREAPRVAAHLRAGWLPADLVEALIGDGQVPPGVARPVGLLVRRIRDLDPTPPVTSAGAAFQSWCGDPDKLGCRPEHRFVEIDGRYARCRCHQSHGKPFEGQTQARAS